MASKSVTGKFLENLLLIQTSTERRKESFPFPAIVSIITIIIKKCWFALNCKPIVKQKTHRLKRGSPVEREHLQFCLYR